MLPADVTDDELGLVTSAFLREDDGDERRLEKKDLIGCDF